LFEEDEMQREIRSLQFWKTLQYYVSEGYLMGCSHSANGVMEEQTAQGILLGHAYGILDAQEPEPGIRLICIRNPWGKLEWKGRYSDNSPEWTPSLMKKLNVVFEDDGTFWMCYEDFVVQYNQTVVLRLLEDMVGKKWHHFSFRSEWNTETAGGCTNFPSWHDNPQYAITCKERNTRVFLSLGQPDVRLAWKVDYEYALGLYVMKTPNTDVPKTSYTNDEVLLKLPFTPAREVGADVVLEPEFKYVIIPCTFDAGQIGKYWLDVYGEEEIDVRPIPRPKKLVARGEWRGATAGGCYNNQSWVNNPKFLISPLNSPGRTVPVNITLRQPNRQPLMYIGMYTGQYVGRFERAMLRGAKPCCNSREFTVEALVQPAEWPYFIIPHTFDAGEVSDFEVFVSSPEPLKIEQLY